MRSRWSLLGLVLPVFLMTMTGCAELQESKISLRNRYLSKEAWKDLREEYCSMNFEKDFGRGFRAGYYDVACGGNGCPRLTPRTILVCSVHEF